MGIFRKRFDAIHVMYENKVTHDPAEFHPENFECNRNEIESNLYSESFNHSSIPSNPEGLVVVEHAIGTCSSIEADRSTLETPDCLGHETVTQQDDEKQYSCNVCGKTFELKRHLDMHLISHGGQKPHTCDICNKSFTRKTNLRRHMLTHDNERTFQCDICNVGFKKKSWDFVNHKLIHSDETLYKCDVCNKKFRSKGHLRYRDNTQ